MSGETSRTTAEVVQDIVGNIQAIVRSEVRLAKAELSEEAVKAAQASALVAAGIVAALFTIWLSLLTALFALSHAIPYWAAALVLLIIMAITTAVLLLTGKKRFKTVHPVPQRTVETIKENAEWVKSQTK
ncbi:MAG TPA: phage holin family protein [Bryobacteraceae bacterium]